MWRLVCTLDSMKPHLCQIYNVSVKPLSLSNQINLPDSRIYHLSFSFKINISQFYNWSSHPRSGHIFSHFFHCLLLQAQGTALLLYTDFIGMDSVFTDNWNTGLVLVGILFKTEFDLVLEMWKDLKLKSFL